tara:strand:- start:373 stop:747 length:375 start_codon:yes stop_codon:yes gene_type:complete
VKYLLIVFCIFANLSVLAQHNLTDEEMIKLDSLLQHYEQNDSIQAHTISLLTKQLSLHKEQQGLDTMLLRYKDQEISLLNNKVSMYIELSELNKPKWYDKKWIWFTLGVVSISTSAYVLDKVNN